jgi:TonB family protein
MKSRLSTAICLVLAIALVAGCAARQPSIPDPGVEVKAVPAPSALNVPMPAEPFPPGSENEPLEPPRVLYLDVPNYPLVARETKIEGSVLVEMQIDHTGKVENERVVETTNPIFNRAALSAAHRCRFEPGKIGGKPIAFRWMIPFEFTLNPSSEGVSGATEHKEWQRLQPLPAADPKTPLPR